MSTIESSYQAFSTASRTMLWNCQNVKIHRISSCWTLNSIMFFIYCSYTVWKIPILFMFLGNIYPSSCTICLLYKSFLWEPFSQNITCSFNNSSNTSIVHSVTMTDSRKSIARNKILQCYWESVCRTYWFTSSIRFWQINGNKTFKRVSNSIGVIRNIVSKNYSSASFASVTSWWNSPSSFLSW